MSGLDADEKCSLRTTWPNWTHQVVDIIYGETVGKSRREFSHSLQHS